MNRLKTITLSCLALCLVCSACNTQTKSGELTVKEALAVRHSVRSFTNDTLTNKELTDILWAANGRRNESRRTAPSAINAQDIDLYVCTAYGVGRYEATTQSLEAVTDQDIRPLFMARNKFVLSAPVNILLVSNLKKFGDRMSDEAALRFAYIDGGIVSENISLYCTSVGLGTVPCAPPLDADTLRKALNLDEKHLPIMYHPIGWPEE